MKKWVFLFAVIILAGVGFYWLLQDGKGGEDDGVVVPDSNVPRHSSPGDAGGEFLILVEPQTSGSAVVIRRAVLARAGYITIHENNGGHPGAVIGVTPLLSVGEHIDVVADLHQSTESGVFYVAVIRSDNGDGEFDQMNDQMVRTEGGSRIMMEFSAE